MTRSGTTYLDNHSTTPVDPAVLEAMLPYFSTEFGNAASSTHDFGWNARDAVDTARLAVSKLIEANPRDIIFTSGATEADNLAIVGVAQGRIDEGRHLITASTEHRAVLDTFEYLENEGWDATYLPVDREGNINLDELRGALRDDTVLVSLMAVNNEIGTVHPIATISEIVEPSRALLHVDAAQGLTYGSVDVSTTPIDLLSISAHKMYGPKGIGALYVRPSIASDMVAQMHGGGHERGLRSGTLDVPSIVGFGQAAVIAANTRGEQALLVEELRNLLQTEMVSALPDIEILGNREHRHPGNLNVVFGGIDAQALLARLHGSLAASTGSACAAATPETSHVLVACGLTQPEGMSAVRFGVGRQNTRSEIVDAVAAVIENVRFLRQVDGSERNRS